MDGENYNTIGYYASQVSSWDLKISFYIISTVHINQHQFQWNIFINSMPWVMWHKKHRMTSLKDVIKNINTIQQWHKFAGVGNQKI